MISDIISGIRAYFRAIGIIRQYRLWKYMIIPSLVSVLIALSIFFVAKFFYGDISNYIFGFYPFEWGSTYIQKILDWFGGILIIILGVLIFKPLAILFVTPFMGPLSFRVQKIIAPDSNIHELNFFKGLTRGGLLAIRNLFKELLYILLLSILSLMIPIISPFTAVFIFVVQAFYAGFGNMDFVLEKYFNKKNSIRFIRNNKGLAIGNGIVFMGLLMTIIGFLFVIPLSSVAATIVATERKEANPN